MKVTALKIQSKDLSRVNVYIDDMFAFGVDQSTMLKLGLRVGLELTAEQLEACEKAALIGKWYNRSLNKLARRPHSEQEVRDYIFQKITVGNSKQKDGHKQSRSAIMDIIDAVIAKLLEYKYLDDRKFAEWFVEQRRSFRQRSNRALRSELAAKHISREIADDVLNENQGDNERESIRALIAKKRRVTRFKDNRVLTLYLARQGFSYDLIKEELEGD